MPVRDHTPSGRQTHSLQSTPQRIVKLHNKSVGAAVPQFKKILTADKGTDDGDRQVTFNFFQFCLTLFIFFQILTLRRQRVKW